MKQKQRMMVHSNSNPTLKDVVRGYDCWMSSSSVFASYTALVVFSLYTPCKCRSVRVPPCSKHTYIMKNGMLLVQEGLAKGTAHWNKKLFVVKMKVCISVPIVC